jgi:hypothetical protein
MPLFRAILPACRARLRPTRLTDAVPAGGQRAGLAETATVDAESAGCWAGATVVGGHAMMVVGR